MEARIIQQQQETERLLTAIEKMEEDYSAWSADYQSILDSRAYRLIQAIWTVTDRMRGRSASGL